MKKTVSIIISLVIALSATVSFCPSSVYAQSSDYFKSITFNALSDDSVTREGYLNSTNTGFRINSILSEDFKPYDMSLYLDDAVVPTDVRRYDNSPDYYFSSNTSTADELKNLLGEGKHDWIVRASDIAGGSQYEIARGSFNFDYTAPEGEFFAKPKTCENPKLLKVGDIVSIEFKEKLGTSDIAFASGKIYDRELTFEETGSSFVADYVVMEGDPDQDSNLILTDVQYSDRAGNMVELADLSIPIGFAIDANSPSVMITSPENKEYNSRDITISYISKPENIISVLFDGEVVPMANGGTLLSVKDGVHQIQVVALDQSGNKSVALAQFSVKTVWDNVAVVASDINKPTVPVDRHRSVKVASNTISSPKVESEQEPANNLELAREGRISSATDYQPRRGANWTAWLILIALLVLAGAIGTTSYYGFAWLSLSKKSTVIVEKLEQPSVPKVEISSQSEIESSIVEKNKPDEPPESYTRW